MAKPFIPQSFGRYSLTERIAIGGMAEILVAKVFGAMGFEKSLVIKRILPQFAEDAEFLQMFITEAKLVCHLEHPNIVQVHELGECDGQFFIAMEYVNGIDGRQLWRTLAKRKQRLPGLLALFIVSEFLKGLDYAHRAVGPLGEFLGVVHRDVSPSNILISYRGDVKIGDFGIALVEHESKTQAGVLKGKFGYMSPEQVAGMKVDHRSDIFAAGIVLCELLLGRRLFLGQSDFETLDKVLNVRLDVLDQHASALAPEVVRIVRGALQREVSDRYQSAQEFCDAITDYLYESRARISNETLALFIAEHVAPFVVSNVGRGEVSAITNNSARSQSARSPITPSGAVPRVLLARGSTGRPDQSSPPVSGAFRRAGAAARPKAGSFTRSGRMKRPSLPSSPIEASRRGSKPALEDCRTEEDALHTGDGQLFGAIPMYDMGSEEMPPPELNLEARREAEPQPQPPAEDKLLAIRPAVASELVLPSDEEEEAEPTRPSFGVQDEDEEDVVGVTQSAPPEESAALPARVTQAEFIPAERAAVADQLPEMMRPVSEPLLELISSVTNAPPVELASPAYLPGSSFVEAQPGRAGFTGQCEGAGEELDLDQCAEPEPIIPPPAEAPDEPSGWVNRQLASAQIRRGDREPDFAGRLSARTVAKVLFRFSVVNETGLLILSGPAGGGRQSDLIEWLTALQKQAGAETDRRPEGDQTCTINLVQGQPSLVSADRSEEELVCFLMRNGVVSHAAVENAITASPHRKPIAALLTAGLMSPLHVSRHVTAFVLSKALQSFAWTEGEFAFYRGQAIPIEAFPTGLDMAALIASGVATLEDADLGAYFRPIAGRQIFLNQTPPARVDFFVPDPTLLETYQALVGGTVAELLEWCASRTSPTAAKRALYLLIECELAALG